jgi:anthranilate phosphoribosyltransferase
VSPLGPTHVIEVVDGATKRWTIHPEEHGFTKISRDDLAGSEPSENARIIVEILTGGGPAGARAAIILNAGAAVYVSGRVKSYGEGVAAATKSIDSGEASAILTRLKSAYVKPLKTRA